MDALALRLAFVSIELVLMIVSVDLLASSDDQPVWFWIGATLMVLSLTAGGVYAWAVGIE